MFTKSRHNSWHLNVVFKRIENIEKKSILIQVFFILSLLLNTILLMYHNQKYFKYLKFFCYRYQHKLIQYLKILMIKQI